MSVVRAYFVMRGGGTVFTRMPEEDVRAVNTALAGRNAARWLAGNGLTLIDLAEVVGVYCTPDEPGPAERLADAAERQVGEGEEWRQ